MATALGGAVGGLLAAIVMAAAMRGADHGRPSLAAALVAAVADGDPADHATAGMALHLLLGTLAGVVLAVGVPTIGASLDPLPVGATIGLGYGLALGVVGLVGWLGLVPGSELDREAAVAVLGSHLLYGVTLGGLLSLVTYT